MHKSLWVFMRFVRSSCLTFGPSRFNGGLDLLIQGKPFVRTLQILFIMFWWNQLAMYEMFVHTIYRMLHQGWFVYLQFEWILVIKYHSTSRVWPHLRNLFFFPTRPVHHIFFPCILWKVIKKGSSYVYNSRTNLFKNKTNMFLFITESRWFTYTRWFAEISYTVYTHIILLGGYGCNWSRNQFVSEAIF